MNKRSRVIPTNYHAAEKIHRSWNGNGQGAVVDRNTRIVRAPEGGGRSSYALQLHETLIVTWYANGTVVLDTDGWRTRTTKERINQALGSRFVGDGACYVHGRTSGGFDGCPGAHHPWGIITPKGEFEFSDGCRIDAAGYVHAVGVGPARQWAEVEAEFAEERALARREKQTELVRNFLAQRSATYAMQAGHLHRIALAEVKSERGMWLTAQALATNAGKPIAAVYPNVDARFHKPLVEIATDSRSKLWEEVALLASQYGVRVAFTSTRELESRMSHFSG